MLISIVKYIKKVINLLQGYGGKSMSKFNKEENNLQKTNTKSFDTLKKILKSDLEQKSRTRKKNITIYISEDTIDLLNNLSQKYDASKSSIIETLISIADMID